MQIISYFSQKGLLFIVFQEFIREMFIMTWFYKLLSVKGI